MKQFGVIIFLIIALGFAVTNVAAGLSADSNAAFAPASDPGNNEQITALLGNLSLFFVPNGGQLDPAVLFTCKGDGFTVYYTSDSIVTSFAYNNGGATGQTAVVQRFVGPDYGLVVEGLDPLETTVSYFTGPEPDWHTGITPFGAIVYRDLYPGIDLIYRGDRGTVKREFVVRPGADPFRIQFIYEGAEQVRVSGDGYLVITTGSGELRESPPFCYQDIDDKRVEIPCRFDQADDGSISFSTGWYDRSLPLMIDPLLSYCGYIGGAGFDVGAGIAVDSAGNAYVTGRTSSDQATFPETIGPDLTYGGGPYLGDAFVAKVNAAGTGLIYCGYIGGNGDDMGTDIAVDSTGNAYVTGQTSSDQATFPEIGGPDLTYNGGVRDAFVAKVNAAGTGLSYCGYIGGANDDTGSGIAVDGTGNTYVTGTTGSDQTTFPETIGPDLTCGGTDAYVAKVNAAGTGLLYCGYIGGAAYDTGYSIAVDSTGNAYVTGQTSSDQTTFPVTIGPDLTYNGDSWDSYIAKVNAAGTGLSYCGYIGGASFDAGSGIAVDSTGNAYVTGQTDSDQTTFPVTIGPDLTYNGHSDDFVAKVNPAGTGLVYCGYIGGSSSESSSGIVVDGAGNAYLTGNTYSGEFSFPLTGGPDLIFNGGESDAFVTKVPALTWVSPGGHTLSSIAVDANPSTNEWFVVIRGTDNHVYFTRYNGSTGSMAGWTPLGGTTNDEPTVAYTNDNTVHVVIRGVDNHLYYKKMNGLTNTWDTLWTSLGGTISSGPTLLSSTSEDPEGPPYLWLAIRGTDNNLYLKGWDPDSGWDTFWQRWGGTTNDRPALAFRYSMAPGGSIVTMGVRGTDNRVYTRDYSVGFGGSGFKGPWISPGGSTLSPPVIFYKDGVLQITLRGTDNRVYHKAGSASYFSMGGTTTDMPAVYSWPGQPVFEVSIRGTDSKIYDRNTKYDVYSGQPIAWIDMKHTAVGHPTFSPGTGSDGMLAIRDPDNHIYLMVV